VKSFLLAFVPLFVAVDAIGVLPLFMNLTSGLERAVIRRIILQSTLTALVVALVFLAIGRFFLGLLGITVADFMVAGGVLLFVISLNDMLSFEKTKIVIDPESLGAVPIGVPLIVGPAVLTTAILLSSQQGYPATAAAIAVNVLIAGAVFSVADKLHAILGKAGSKTISKLASLLLAAIAVMMVRKGLMIYISGSY